MKTETKNFYVIRGLGMANYLVRQGFDIKKVEDNRSNSYFKVFIFEDSEELRTAISQYK